MMPNRCFRFLALVAVFGFGPSAKASGLEVIEFRTGFLIVDGKYIQPPYKIDVLDDAISINGTPYEKAFFEVSDIGLNNAARQVSLNSKDTVGRSDEFGNGEIREPGFRRWQRQRERMNPLRKTASVLRDAAIGGIVVVYPNEIPLIVYPNSEGHGLLTALLDRPGAKLEPPVSLLPGEKKIWSRVIADFEPSGDFSHRAEKELSLVDQAAVNGDRVSAALGLSNRLSYPLSVLAMIAVVLGFGHLLSNRPVVDEATQDESKGPKIILQSLFIIALFSVVDLIWTVVASGSGAMRELNPLGSHLIRDPQMLTGFKLALTGTSIAILYGLRRKPVAHLATWWCCLLMTLLTARWVVFHSMFL